MFNNSLFIMLYWLTQNLNNQLFLKKKLRGRLTQESGILKSTIFYTFCGIFRDFCGTFVGLWDFCGIKLRFLKIMWQHRFSAHLNCEEVFYCLAMLCLRIQWNVPAYYQTFKWLLSRKWKNVISEKLIVIFVIFLIRF